jgi:hypothetical protein
MSKIYYAVKPNFSTVTRYAEEGDFTKVYDLVYQITNNHDVSADASSWCELASVGEKYEFDNFTEGFAIEIIED